MTVWRELCSINFEVQRFLSAECFITLELTRFGGHLISKEKGVHKRGRSSSIPSRTKWS